MKVSEDRELQLIKEKLRMAQELTLESKGYTIANEYYTAEEMAAAAAAFKKKKVKGKLRKNNKSLKADDLLDGTEPTATSTTNADVGSRWGCILHSRLTPLQAEVCPTRRR